MFKVFSTHSSLPQNALRKNRRSALFYSFLFLVLAAASYSFHEIIFPFSELSRESAELSFYMLTGIFTEGFALETLSLLPVGIIVAIPLLTPLILLILSVYYGVRSSKEDRAKSHSYRILELIAVTVSACLLGLYFTQIFIFDFVAFYARSDLFLGIPL